VDLCCHMEDRYWTHANDDLRREVDADSRRVVAGL